MIASSPTMPARLPLIASFTFWLWRAMSIGPLRCSDQSCCESVTVNIGPTPSAIQERADVLQQLVGAQVAEVLLLHHAVDHVVDAAELLGVRGLGGSGDLHHVA